MKCGMTIVVTVQVTSVPRFVFVQRLRAMAAMSHAADQLNDECRAAQGDQAEIHTSPPFEG